MSNDSGLPKELWAEAVNTANNIRCRSPTAKGLRRPFHNQKPDVSQMRTFGATAYSHVLEEERQKLNNRSICGVKMGYAAHTKGYRILLEDHTVIISRDVIFDKGTGATKAISHSFKEMTLSQSTRSQSMRSQSMRSQSISSQSIRSCLRSHSTLNPHHPSLQPRYAALPEPLAGLASGERSHLLLQPAAVANSGSKHGTASAMSATLL